jgi:multidrug efflux pump subunit AcrA (membrane-fusion protein)
MISRIVTKPYIVKAQGTVISIDNQYVTSNLNGYVKKITVSEGSRVESGDILLYTTNGQDGLQVSAIQKQIDYANEKLAVLDRYKKSLDSKKNLMKNLGDEQGYYGKVAYYLLQVKSDAYNNSILVIDLTGKKKELKTAQSETLKQKAILNNVNSSIAEKQVADARLDAASTTIERLNSEIKQLQQKLDQPLSQSQQTYSQLLGELGAEHAQIESSIVQLTAQKNQQIGQDAEFAIRVKNSGVVHYLVPLKNGMAIQQNQTIAEISDSPTKDLEVEAFVPANDISKVKTGNKVKVAIAGVNAQKYGTINGILHAIDSGTITQQTQAGNLTFYKCVVTIDANTLSASDGSKVQIRKSMPVEARIVYDRETYFEWLMGQLNFVN